MNLKDKAIAAAITVIIPFQFIYPAHAELKAGLVKIPDGGQVFIANCKGK